MLALSKSTVLGDARRAAPSSPAQRRPGGFTLQDPDADPRTPRILPSGDAATERPGTPASARPGGPVEGDAPPAQKGGWWTPPGPPWMRAQKEPPRTRVGEVDTGTLSHRCADSPNDVRADTAQELRQKLKDYISGFMNDPSHPRGQVSWPGVDLKPTDAWNSPLAHKYFFHWYAVGPASISGHFGDWPDAAIGKDKMNEILDLISMQQTVCGQSVAEGLIHAMDKGGDDDKTTWPEYLNAIFSIGPASDSGAPDPTVKRVLMANVTRKVSDAEKAAADAAAKSPSASDPPAKSKQGASISDAASGLSANAKIAIGAGAVLAVVFAIVRLT